MGQSPLIGRLPCGSGSRVSHAGIDAYWKTFALFSYLNRADSEAKLKAESAFMELTTIMNDIPGGLPESDG
jgi:hypothetical protein